MSGSGRGLWLEEPQPMALINPEIISRDGYCFCRRLLVRARASWAVERAQAIEVRFQDRNGVFQSLEARDYYPYAFSMKLITLMGSCISIIFRHLSAKSFSMNIGQRLRSCIRESDFHGHAGVCRTKFGCIDRKFYRCCCCHHSTRSPTRAWFESATNACCWVGRSIRNSCVSMGAPKR